jgi:hypothetical protein
MKRSREAIHVRTVTKKQKHEVSHALTSLPDDLIVAVLSFLCPTRVVHMTIPKFWLYFHDLITCCAVSRSLRRYVNDTHLANVPLMPMRRARHVFWIDHVEASGDGRVKRHDLIDLQSTGSTLVDHVLSATRLERQYRTNKEWLDRIVCKSGWRTEKLADEYMDRAQRFLSDRNRESSPHHVYAMSSRDVVCCLSRQAELFVVHSRAKSIDDDRSMYNTHAAWVMI